MRTIVISAVNLIEGGTYTILCQCLSYIVSSDLVNEFEFVVLVNNKTMFDYDKLTFLEFPKAKQHWINRIFYEYFYFKKLAKKYKPYLWLSLHDITPSLSNVERIATYMHNPSPFDHLSIKRIMYYGYKYILFAIFYRYLYRLNIHKNTFCIVQQQWLREAFSKMYHVDPNKIIVAHPTQNIDIKLGPIRSTTNEQYTFFFPSFPRPFKNIEVICMAAELLEKHGITNFRVKLTIDGSELRYAKWIVKRYKHLETVEFIGLQSKEEMRRLYDSTDCLIFPSYLETWGLPISEFKIYGRPMIIADKPYAHETAAGSGQVAFFNTESPEELSSLMKNAMDGDLSIFKTVIDNPLQQPYASNWEELFVILLR